VARPPNPLTPFSHPIVIRPDALLTSHEAEEFVAAYQQAGYIKRCAHLSIRKHSVSLSTLGYRPVCAQDAFDQEAHQPYAAGGLTITFYGCPPDCRRYQSATRARWIRYGRIAGRTLWNFFAGLGTWYASLSGMAQLVLALLVAGLISLSWRTTLLEIVRALKGLPP
jgi:hypothetical protein